MGCLRRLILTVLAVRLCIRESVCHIQGLKILGGRALYFAKHQEDCMSELSNQGICCFQCNIFWALCLDDPFHIFFMRDMPYFMRYSEVSGECPEKHSECHVWYKSQVQACLQRF